MNTRLTSVEGQRVMSILDDAIQKLGFVTLLKKEILNGVESHAGTFGDDASVLLALKSASDRLNAAVDKDDYELLEHSSSEIEDTTSSICRILKEHPEQVEKLKSLQVKVGNPKTSASLRAFLGAFNELRDLTHLRLASTVEDERARSLFFAGIYFFTKKTTSLDKRAYMVSKEKKMSSDLRALIDKLSEARLQRERDSGARKAQLTKLREELKDMRETTVNEAKVLEKETTSREAFDLANFTEAENAKTEELQTLQKNLEEKSSLNKKKELMLRKKKARVEKELENWIIKYDQELEEKETELNQLKQEYDRELKELKETEDAYDKVLKEREAYLAEHRRREQQAKREKSKKKRLDEAAKTIQRAWKRFKRFKKPVTAVTPPGKGTKGKGADIKTPSKQALSSSPSKQTAKPKPKVKDAKSPAASDPKAKKEPPKKATSKK